MKATIIITTLFLFAAFMGCSDNLNINDPLKTDNHPGNQLSKISAPGNNNMDLLWKYDLLVVNATIETMVENEVVYTMSPYFDIGTYIINFDGYTNSNKYANGYGSLAKITKDMDVVFEAANKETINGTHKIRLENVRFGEIKFYISLFQIDGLIQNSGNTDYQNICTLKLSNIRIYRLN